MSPLAFSLFLCNYWFYVLLSQLIPDFTGTVSLITGSCFEALIGTPTSALEECSNHVVDAISPEAVLSFKAFFAFSFELAKVLFDYFCRAAWFWDCVVDINCRQRWSRSRTSENSSCYFPQGILTGDATTFAFIWQNVRSNQIL